MEKDEIGKSGVRVKQQKNTESETAFEKLEQREQM